MVPEVVNALMQAAIDLLAQVVPILAIVVGQWAARKVLLWWTEVRLSLPENVRIAIDQAAELGIKFAEQVELDDRIEHYARTKLQIAIEAANKYLLEQGYEVDSAVLEAAIEKLLFDTEWS